MMSKGRARVYRARWIFARNVIEAAQKLIGLTHHRHHICERADWIVIHLLRMPTPKYVD